MPVSTDPRIGTELLGYRIESLLGRGGMGVVYKAYDPRLNRYVALKLVAPELSGDERFRERFLRESELSASLEHPNVIPIYDAREVDGRLVIAMRLVEGTDLKALVRKERGLAPVRAFALLTQLADALDMLTRVGSSTVTSSPRTRCSTPPTTSILSTSGWRRAPPIGASRPVRSLARLTTSLLSRSRGGRSTGAPTSTRSAACCTSA